MQISNVPSGKISKWVNSINWVDSSNFFFFLQSTNNHSVTMGWFILHPISMVKLRMAAQGRFLPWMNVITALRRGLRDNSPSTAALGACWHSVLSWPLLLNKRNLNSLQGESSSTKASSVGFDSIDLIWEMLPQKNTLQRFKAASSTKPASGIHNWNTAAHISLALNGSTEHPTHLSILLPSWLSSSLTSLPAFHFFSRPRYHSLCSSCRTVISLWSLPCSYPLILVPALSFNYISATTLLKCCQPFSVVSSRRKQTQLAINAGVHCTWWMDHFRFSIETHRALFSAVRVNTKGIKLSISCLLYFSPSKCHASCSMMCSANLSQFSWWSLEKQFIP